MSEEQDRRAEREALIASHRDYYSAIDFAIEVQTFMGSRLGLYLVERAEEEREAAMKELVEVDATDMNKIRRLQSDIKRAESIQYWMAELLQEGKAAQETLMNMDAASAGGEE